MRAIRAWPGARVLLLLLPLLIVHVIAAPNLPDPKQFKFPLEIQHNAVSDWNPNQAKVKMLTYTGMATYKEDTNKLFDDAALTGLAWQAYIEMLIKHEEIKKGCRDKRQAYFPQPPDVMSAMAIGKKVYFASSFRGGNVGKFWYVKMKDSEMTKTLNECQIWLAQLRDEEDVERHRGSCAEVFAVAQFVQDNGKPPRKVTGKDGPKEVENARIAAWATWSAKKDNPWDGGYAVDACDGAPETKDTPKGWGCRQYMHEYQGVKTLFLEAFNRANRRKNKVDPSKSEVEPESVIPGGFSVGEVHPVERPEGTEPETGEPSKGKEPIGSKPEDTEPEEKK
ncbi:MAG: hypothetical protein M1833_004741 [Piccolia ochrophora]|nr:MAG: hypothetical protein M1833_004741 [Piccolia ochrophora]